MYFPEKIQKSKYSKNFSKDYYIQNKKLWDKKFIL